MELEGKSIIITGASSGIGAAAASLFAAEGANVVLGARRSAELASLVERINGRNGRAFFLAGDVREEGYAEALVELATSEFGALDSLSPPRVRSYLAGSPRHVAVADSFGHPRPKTSSASCSKDPTSPMRVRNRSPGARPPR